MHARELVELAAMVACQGHLVVDQRGGLPAAQLESYWMASKVRLDRWGRALRQIRQVQVAADASVTRYPPLLVRSLFEEILASEVLTRVWTATLTIHDQRRQQQEGSLLARSVWLGHQESRHRAMQTLVHGEGVRLEEAVALNRVRRRAEHWADLLLALLAVDEDVSAWGVHPERVRRLAAEVRCSSRWSSPDLLLAMLRAAFRQLAAQCSPNADLNARVAAGILQCFPATAFDHRGLLPSLRMARLSVASDDVQVLINDWLASYDQPEPLPIVAAPFRRKAISDL